VTETNFLGHAINGETTRMQDEKLKSILEWPIPTKCKDIEEFRGLAGYYRQYIKRFSDKSKALNECLRKNEFKWTPEEAKAFEQIKESYRENPILIIHDPEKETWLHADASDYAIGVEISQKDKEGRRRPVLFYSRKLLPAEMNYSTPDKEMLAIVHTMKKFQHYLRGTKHPVIVKSDHRNLQAFMTTKELNARQARWAEELSSYNFITEHIKGKENKVADALSRRPDYRENTEFNRTTKIFEETERGLILNKNIKLNMMKFNNEDEEIKKRIKESTKEKELNPDIKEDEDGLKRLNGLIIVPKELEQKILERYHDDPREGHQGIARTIEKIQRNFYFPGMYKKMKRYIANCEACARSKHDYTKPKGKMQIEKDRPTKPWTHISVDLLEMPETSKEESSERYDGILVVVDQFSKQTILIPTRKNAKTEETYDLLWERVFSVFGIPKRMISDRDKIFRTERWKNLMNEIGSTVVLSTAYHQQTDGQTERKIQELQVYFRIYMDYQQKNWLQICPMAQYAINDAKSSATGETPHFTVFGNERCVDNEEDNEHQRRMKIIHEKVKNEIDWTKRTQKENYDKNRMEAISLEKGDRVYLRRRTKGNKNFNLKTKRPSTKLDYLKLGPFLIEEKLEYDNYKLKLPSRMKLHPIFHVSLLTKTNNSETTDNESIDDEEYEVERILDKRTRQGKVEYLVKWLGYENCDNSWEPITHLNCPQLIQEFEYRQLQKTKKRQKLDRQKRRKQEYDRSEHGLIELFLSKTSFNCDKH
jgi:hypothetical protein